MTHDTRWSKIVLEQEQYSSLLDDLLRQAGPHQEPPSLKQRGRPAQVLLTHLGWAIFWCFLQGWQTQLDLWRQISNERLAGFAPVCVCDQAVYKRLATAGGKAMQVLFEQVSAQLHHRLDPLEQWSLAPFASAVIAVDESKLDQVGRWLSGLREVPVADAGLLAGRLSCLFDVRRQQWVRVDVLPQATGNSLLHARHLLDGMLPQTLLLFDLGYFSFEWLDELTRRGLFWVSRLRKRGSYQVQHVFVQQDGYLDALVFLGAYRSDQARFAVRLIQVGRGQQTRRYLSNVLDPRLLSGAEIVRLYARRWDIELAFRTLKDHLHLRVLWSAKWEVLLVQILASVILAQVFHGVQVELAAQQHVEVFDVSLDLLIRLLPRKLLMGQSSGNWLRTQGRRVGIIRSGSRLVYEVPQIAEYQINWPSGPLRLERPPRYAHKQAGNTNRKPPTSSFN